MSYLKGWKYAVFITGFVGATVAALYPIVISPMIDPSYYKSVQKITRKDIVQEDIQPGNMRVWSDPFEPRK